MAGGRVGPAYGGTHTLIDSRFFHFTRTHTHLFTSHAFSGTTISPTLGGARILIIGMSDTCERYCKSADTHYLDFVPRTSLNKQLF